MNLKSLFFGTAMVISLPYSSKSQNALNMDTVRALRSEPILCGMGWSQEAIESANQWGRSKHGTSDYQTYRLNPKLDEERKEEVKILDSISAPHQQAGWTLKTVTAWGNKEIKYHKYQLDYLANEHNKIGNTAWLSETYHVDSEGHVSIDDQQCSFLQTDHTARESRFLTVDMYYHQGNNTESIVSPVLIDKEDYDRYDKKPEMWGSGTSQNFSSPDKARQLFESVLDSVASEQDLKKLYNTLENGGMQSLGKDGEDYTVVQPKLHLSQEEKKEVRATERKIELERSFYLRNYIPGEKRSKENEKVWSRLDGKMRHFVDSMAKPICAGGWVATIDAQSTLPSFFYTPIHEQKGHDNSISEMYIYNNRTRSYELEYSSVDLKDSKGDTAHQTTEEIHLWNSPGIYHTLLSSDFKYETTDWVRGIGSKRTSKSYHLLPEGKDFSSQLPDQRGTLLQVANLTRKGKSIAEVIQEFKNGNIIISPYKARPFENKLSPDD